MRFSIFIGAVCFLIAADGPPDQVKKDTARLEGEWSMVSGEINGKAMPDALLKGSRRVAKDGVTTVTIGGMPFMKAKFTIDPSKKPKTIDYLMLEGFTKGKKQFGIYEIDDDMVKFCFASPGKDRPDDFTAKEGSGRTLSVWKKVARAKKDD
jgi:uncharacterized protein (TIGR03067 family)